MRRVREQIKASHLPELPLFFTEWSTSYNPRDPIHDSHLSAPYILEKLRATRGLFKFSILYLFAMFAVLLLERMAMVL